MRGTLTLYLWVCVVGYATWSGFALPVDLDAELAAGEGDEQEWVQGEEMPFTQELWEDEEEGDMNPWSPDSDKRQYPGGKRQYPGGKRQYPGGKRQYPGGKRQYPAGKRQFVGGELIPSPEVRQYPGGKRQYPGGKRQYPGGKRQYPAGKRQYPGGKRQYPGGKRADFEDEIPPMEIRQYPGGKRQFPAGKRQYPGGKRQYPGGKRQFPGGKRQFIGGDLTEQETAIDKRFAPNEDAFDVQRLVQLYALNDNNPLDEQDLEVEDLLGNILVDTRPEMEKARGMFLDNIDSEDKMALDLPALINGPNEASKWLQNI